MSFLYTSDSSIHAIPDGYLIDFPLPENSWLYSLENKLSSHTHPNVLALKC